MDLSLRDEALGSEYGLSRFPRVRSTTVYGGRQSSSTGMRSNDGRHDPVPGPGALLRGRQMPRIEGKLHAERDAS